VVEDHFEPNVHPTNDYKGSFITTVRPKTSRPTQKYYMNLVTEQPYQPTEKYKNEPSKEITFSATSNKNQEYPSLPSNKQVAATFPKVFDSDSHTESPFYYKDIQGDSISDFDIHDTLSVSASVPGKDPSTIEQSGEKTIVKYVPIDKPKFYYKPVVQETTTKEPVFYYKPVVPKTHTKTITYKRPNIGSSYNKPFTTNLNSFHSIDAPETLKQSSDISSHKPVVSKLQYTTPHPLVYGFKPLTFKSEPFTTITSNQRSPKYLTSPSFPPTHEVSQLEHYTPFSHSKKLYGDNYPSSSVSKPVRFPYDKRHYYSGRFVSTF